MSAALRRGRAVTHSQEHTDVPAAWECHVHRAFHVAPKQPGHPVDCTVLGALQQNWWSINIDDSRQSTSRSRQSSLSGANCCRVSSIAPLVSGATGLSASSRSKAKKLNIWCKNCSMWVTLDNSLNERINKVGRVWIFVIMFTLSHLLIYFLQPTLQPDVYIFGGKCGKIKFLLLYITVFLLYFHDTFVA